MQFTRHRLSADTDLSQASSAFSPTEDKTAGTQDFPSPEQLADRNQMGRVRVGAYVCLRRGWLQEIPYPRRL